MQQRGIGELRTEMVGYGPFSRKYYHKEGEYVPDWEGWASQCSTKAYIAYRWPDDKEAELNEARPDLSRCPRCWKGEK